MRLLSFRAAVALSFVSWQCGCQNIPTPERQPASDLQRTVRQDPVAEHSGSDRSRNTEERDDQDLLEGSVGGVVVSTFWLPYFKVSGDRDDEVPGPAGVFRADLDAGYGWAARMGFGSSDANIGLLYLTSHHDERETGARARTHSVYVEFWRGTDREVSADVDLFAGIGLGVGGALFDFSRTFDDSGAAAVEGRVAGGLRVSEHFRLEVGGGLFLWGYPGETIGTGGFFTLGGSVVF
ncbi:MAG: hypothetical protein ACKVX7_09870 [Planctomycetota bacterium]